MGAPVTCSAPDGARQGDVGVPRVHGVHEVYRAVLGSALPSGCRLILLVLADTSPATAAIPMPLPYLSVGRLARQTALATRAVERNLVHLRTEGWVTRT